MQTITKASLLNMLVERYGLTRYLEIGCRDDQTFRRVKAKHKTGVDPRKGGTHRMTSDAFFDRFDNTFDLVFVDGMHHSSQVLRDVQNSLDRLDEPGFVVLHDCLPKTERSQAIVDDKGQPILSANKYTGRAWHGDVWKAMAIIRTWPHVDSVTLNADSGLGIVVNRPNVNRPPKIKSIESLTWERYRRDKNLLLRVIEPEQLNEWLP